MLRGIHIQSTAPSRVKNQDYHPSCLEVASMVLSALLWRKNCGTIKLYTDNTLHTFLAMHELTALWDDGINTTTIEAIPSSVNQTVFWAAAKLFALHDAAAPVAMVDCDLFFWRDIKKDIDSECLTVLHREELVECYVPQEQLGKPVSYHYNDCWDWTVCPCNTAFAYFPHNEFKKIYTEEAIRFMVGNAGRDAKPSSQMVFAEQRILAMCAKCNHVSIKTVIDNPYDDKNTLFTHLWVAKNRARKSEKDMKELVGAIMEKIKELDLDCYNKISEIYKIC